MSVSYYAVAVRPPDERWLRMKAVYDACVAVGIEIPAPVMEFFNNDDPDPNGVVIDIPHREWQTPGRSGVEVDLSDIPSDVRTIRFVISW